MTKNGENEKTRAEGRLQEVLWQTKGVQHEAADAVGVQQVALGAVPKAGAHGAEGEVHGAAVSAFRLEQDVSFLSLI